MRLVVYLAALSGGCFGLTYFIHGFLAWEWNILLWTEETREDVLATTFVSALVAWLILNGPSR